MGSFSACDFNSQLVDLAHAQDVEAGDGTTTVTVIAGAFLGAVQKLLTKGIHPTAIAEAFLKAAQKSEEILQSMSTSVDLTDRQSLLNSCNTSLNSKVRFSVFTSVDVQSGCVSILQHSFSHCSGLSVARHRP